MEHNGFFTPTAAHAALRGKERRLIFQIDALGEGEMRGMRTDVYEKYIFGYIDGGAPADAVYWDCMLAGDFYAMYDSALLPRRTGAPFDEWLRDGFDLFGTLTRGARRRGIESILVHRISEVDLPTGAGGYEEKLAHPEWQVAGSWESDWLASQGRPRADLLNIAAPEVRRRKLAILNEILGKYDFDGLEIDLCRHTPFLPLGKEWENRAALTEFLVSLRRMLDRLEEEKGHPFLLSVRTGESPERVKTDGADVETWLARNLIDSITAGGRSFSPSLESYRALIERYGGGQQLYATIDYHHASDGYACPPAEVWRGVCAACRARGADGMKLFNWWTCSAAQRREAAEELGLPSLARFPANCQDRAVMELAGENASRRADRTYVAERRGGYPWAEYSNTNCDAPLPMPAQSEGDVILFCAERAENLAAPDCRTVLSVTYSDTDKPVLSAFLGGTELERVSFETHVPDRLIPPKGTDLASGYDPENRPVSVDLQKAVFAVPAGLLRTGFNTFHFTAETPLTIERTELHVRYASGT